MRWIRHGQSEDDSVLRPDAERLQALDLFMSVPAANLAPVLTMATWQVYQSGAFIARPRHGGDVECIVVTGRVRLVRTSEAGRILAELELGQGKVFDFGHLLGPWADELSGEALETTTICSVPWPVFLRAVVATPASAAVLIEQLREDRRHLGDLVGDAVLHDVPTRVRHVLRTLALDNPQHIVSMRGEDIAARVGVSKEQVSRVIADLQRRRLLVRRGRQTFVVYDPDRLL